MMKPIVAAALVSAGLLMSGTSFAAAPSVTSFQQGTSLSAQAKVKPAKKAKKAKKARKAKAV